MKHYYSILLMCFLFALSSCKTKCTHLIEYQQNGIHIKPIATPIGNIGDTHIEPKFREAEEKIEMIDLAHRLAQVSKTCA